METTKVVTNKEGIQVVEITTPALPVQPQVRTVPLETYKAQITNQITGLQKSIVAINDGSMLKNLQARIEVLNTQLTDLIPNTNA